MSHRPARLRLAVCLIASALLAACGSEEPAGEAEDPSGLDDSGIRSGPVEGDGAGPREVTFDFPPGSAIPNAEVVITNLDDAAPAVTFGSDAEGSARVTFSASDGDEIRFQITTEERRYQPRDFSLGRADGKNTLLRSERPTCLRLDPGFELGFDASLAQLSVYNNCSEVVALAEPRLRLGALGDDFELVTLMPVEIGGGVSAGIELRMTPAAARPSEDVLFLDAEVGAERLRYAIGLYAPR